MSGAGGRARTEGGRQIPAAAVRSRSSAFPRAPAAPGQIILQCLKINNFKGDIHLVGRSRRADRRPAGAEERRTSLPEGVDLAVFTLPAAGVREAIEACARRKVGSAMVFAAGFAEVGDTATAGRRRPRPRARPASPWSARTASASPTTSTA